MRDYRVRWEIDIAADTPQHAAEKARESQAPDTTAQVFDVFERIGENSEGGMFHRVASIDLTYPKETIHFDEHGDPIEEGN